MNAPKDTLIELENGFLNAYKAKDAQAFTKNFAPGYIGIANDGVQNAESEVTKMGRFDIQELRMEDAEVTFPAQTVGIVTYKMVSSGRLDGQEFTGVLHTSTVYVLQDDARWKAVLHTESLAQ